MKEFIMFYAPFIVLFAAIGAAFWIALRGADFDENQ